jgi:hypothetical protein
VTLPAILMFVATGILMRTNGAPGYGAGPRGAKQALPPDTTAFAATGSTTSFFRTQK